MVLTTVCHRHRALTGRVTVPLPPQQGVENILQWMLRAMGWRIFYYSSPELVTCDPLLIKPYHQLLTVSVFTFLCPHQS